MRDFVKSAETQIYPSSAPNSISRPIYPAGPLYIGQIFATGDECFGSVAGKRPWPVSPDITLSQHKAAYTPGLWTVFFYLFIFFIGADEISRLIGRHL